MLLGAEYFYRDGMHLILLPHFALLAANYVNIWKAERLLAASLLAVIPGAFMFPNAVMDSLLAISVTMHLHW